MNARALQPPNAPNASERERASESRGTPSERPAERFRTRARAPLNASRALPGVHLTPRAGTNSQRGGSPSSGAHRGQGSAGRREQTKKTHGRWSFTGVALYASSRLWQCTDLQGASRGQCRNRLTETTSSSQCPQQISSSNRAASASHPDAQQIASLATHRTPGASQHFRTSEAASSSTTQTLAQAQP